MAGDLARLEIHGPLQFQERRDVAKFGSALGNGGEDFFFGEFSADDFFHG
jgi:hypothetical protein